MRIKKLLIIILLFFCFIAFVNVNLVQAQPIVPDAPTQSGQDGNVKYEEGSYDLNDFTRLIVGVANMILGIVGGLVLLFFIYGGIMMIISSGNQQKVEEARNILKNATIGIAIVLCSWLIIYFVQSSFGLKEELKIKSTSLQFENNNVISFV